MNDGAGTASLLHELVAAVDAGEPVILATVVGTCHSVPRHAGSKMLVRPDGRCSGSLGGGPVEQRVVGDALVALSDEEPRIVRYDLTGECGGEMTVYLEPHLPAQTVLVVGCGHVGRAVVALAHWLGFRVVAVDSRAEMLTEERLPGADLRLAGLAADMVAQVPVTAGTHVVVTTSSVQADVAVLARLLGTPARTIGVIGSRRRWQATRTELAARGFPEETLDRVRTPAGLDLGAETPREIALAVVGEIVAARRRAGGERPS